MTKKKIAKPILVVRFPIGSIDSRKIEEIAFEDLQKKMDDYHVVGLRDNSVDRIEFECYNSPHTDIEFEDLRESLLDAVRKAADEEGIQKTIREKALTEMMRLDQEMGLYDDPPKESKYRIKVYSAFPGTGKSTYSDISDLGVLDLDSSKFPKEDFPENYIKHIEEKINDPSIDRILVSSHKTVRDALEKYNIPFVLVYPKRSLKDEYIRRYRLRGNPESFINLLDEYWDEWISEMSEQRNCEKVILDSNMYLSQIMPDTQIKE
jgi:hypothetical protein